jgi:hypothetical protein
MAAITAAAIGAGTAIYASKQASKQAKEQGKLAQKGIDAADPFREYRPKYAEQLDKLMSDPSSITSTPEYKARLDAAARQMAAQGYTGSGNAIIEAANAGGAAYQQAFQNLGQLSGAGVTPGGGFDSALASQSESNAQKLSAYTGVANNIGNLALTAGQRFNRAATPTSTAPANNSMIGSMAAATGGKY